MVLLFIYMYVEVRIKTTAYNVLCIIKNFIHMDDTTFILLYKSMVRPHVEFANSVGCPFKHGDIIEIKK